MKLDRVKGLVNSLIKQLEQMNQRSKTRKQLLNLDGHQLKDIGLTQQQALQEGKRYFWQGNDLVSDDDSNKLVTEKKYAIKPGSEHGIDVAIAVKN